MRTVSEILAPEGLNMKPIIRKVLESGLIDKHMALIMEKWGQLPAGASDLVKEDALKNATKEQLTALAEELGDEVEKLQTLKETDVDLKRLRWPVSVSVRNSENEQICYEVPAVIDRMGRLFFRIQDVDLNWFVPGYVVSRDGVNRSNPNTRTLIREQILETTVLYTDDKPVALQVTVHRLA